MKAYQKERIENLICFFAREHKRKTKDNPFQTQIYKYISFFEFRLLEKTGEMPLGLSYRAMEYGPVPIDIYDIRQNLNSDIVETKSVGGEKILFHAKAAPNLDYFSDIEIEEMNNLIFIFAQKWVSAKIMSDASHNEIIPWKKAWIKNPNSDIDVSAGFENVLTKPPETLTDTEEHFLMWQSFQRLNKASCG